MATRSWWGWGTVENAVRGDERARLTSRVAALLPGADLTVHEAPELSSLSLPEPRVAPPASLAHLCSSSLPDRVSHSHGKAFRDVVRNLLGSLSSVPDVVARPGSSQDVVDLLDWCGSAGIAVIPYGGGSSVVGGIEPRFDGPCVTVDMESLAAVSEVDPVSRAARIQAGVLGPALEDQLRPHGLTLRHFPQSFEFSSLGGWLATRAGGHYASLYTHIDDLVESMQVVTPAGVCESRRLPGSGAGPSPDRLFLGSEGALGVITEAWMRLQERPRFRARSSVSFASYEDGVSAVRLISQAGLYPANCRLLDPAEAFLNAGASSSVLVLGFESADHPVSASLERALEICRDCGGVVSDEDSGSAWRSSFLRMPYQRDALAQQSLIVETFETACTWDRFLALRSAVMDAAMGAIKSVAGIGVVSCRFTHVYPDGPAPYFGVYAAGRWGSTVAQWDEIKAAVSSAILGAGGTITHHHAVGRDHLPWYERQRPDVFAAALFGAKAALDPGGMLNPGVLVSPGGSLGPAPTSGSIV